jgi:SH3-like domain-containing protein
MSFSLNKLSLCFFLLLIANSTVTFAEIIPEQQQPNEVWASLIYKSTNGRAGPGKAFHKLWIYHRKYLPVKILRKSSQWSQIKDMDGTVLWMHNSVLNKRKTALVISTQPAYLYGIGRKREKTIARLAPNVIVRIDICEKVQCKVRIKDQIGWINIADLWGATGS